MHHLRWNIAGALGAIVLVAVGFAALRDANELWDRWLFSLMLGLLLFSVLSTVHRTGDRRAFWIGFALFGWGYLSLSLIPTTEPRLIATEAISRLYHSKLFAIREHELRVILSPDRLRAYNLSSQDVIQAITPSGTTDFVEQFKPKMLSEYVLSCKLRYSRPEQYENIILKASPDGEILRLIDVAEIDAAHSFYAPRVGVGADENFIRIGHTLFTLLAACLGGVLSRRLRIATETPGNR